jgi:hypothetical protein
MSLQDLIAKLPVESQPIANKWLEYLITMSVEQSTAMISYLQSGQELAAYELVVSQMTAPQLIAAMKETNDRIKGHTGKVLSQSALRKEMFGEIVSTFWTIALAWVKFGPK